MMLYDYEWFVTITFDLKKVNSFDYLECSEVLSQWLNDVKKLYSPDIRCLFIPKLHVSRNYYFHGLLGEIGTLPLVDSGKRDHGHVIYNIDCYNLGFAKAVKIFDESVSLIDQYHGI